MAALISEWYETNVTGICRTPWRNSWSSCLRSPMTSRTRRSWTSGTGLWIILEKNNRTDQHKFPWSRLLCYSCVIHFLLIFIHTVHLPVVLFYRTVMFSPLRAKSFYLQHGWWLHSRRQWGWHADRGGHQLVSILFHSILFYLILFYHQEFECRDFSANGLTNKTIVRKY